MEWPWIQVPHPQERCSQVVGQTKVHCAPDLPTQSSPSSACMHAWWWLFKQSKSIAFSQAWLGGWWLGEPPSAASSYARVAALSDCTLFSWFKRGFILAWSPNSKSCLHRQVKGVRKNQAPQLRPADFSDC